MPRSTSKNGSGCRRGATPAPRRRRRFAGRNTRSAPDRLDIALVDGPFRRLEGHWRFTQLGDAGCKVALVLEYEFASRLLERLIGPVFAGIADSLVDAFVNRADQLDGA